MFVDEGHAGRGPVWAGCSTMLGCLGREWIGFAPKATHCLRQWV